MRICSWNVRGLVLGLLRVKKSLGLLLAINVVFTACWKLESDLKLALVDTGNGNIIMLFLIKEDGMERKSADMTLQVLMVHEQLIHCRVSVPWQHLDFFVTVMYGLHTIDDRMGLWTALRNLAPGCQGTPWLLLGDLNAVPYTTDRLNGNAITFPEVRDPAQVLEDLQLSELKSTGSFYSWSSKGQGDTRVHSRIDRAFGNDSWIWWSLC